MLYTIDGLVVRVIDRDDHDKLLTILTPERGQVTMIAKGARSMHSKLLPLVQPYTYANFEIYNKDGGLGWLRGGSVIQPFYGVSRELDKLCLAAYLSEALLDVTGEEQAAVDILRLTLNSLYVLSEGRQPAWIVKGVWEWQVACLSGYGPALEGCHVCGRPGAEVMYLDVMNGQLLCGECLSRQSRKLPARRAYDDMDGERSLLLPISPSVLAACRYILSVPSQRIFAFTLEESERDGFASVCENYLLHHLERDFESLKFYKEVEKGNGRLQVTN